MSEEFVVIVLIATIFTLGPICTSVSEGAPAVLSRCLTVSGAVFKPRADESRSKQMRRGQGARCSFICSFMSTLN
jgi:hypothetical protein